MNGGANKKPGGKEEEQDGLSVHSPCKAPNSSVSSLRKEQSQVELELKLLEVLERYRPVKLQGMHRHFVVYGLIDYMEQSFNRQFSATDILQLLDRFYNLEMLKPDEAPGILNQVEEFSLPPSVFTKEES